MNIIGILKELAVATREKFNQKFWYDIFPVLKKCIQESEDEKKLSSAYKILAKHWPKMHDAGVDMEEIVQVLHPLDVIEQFEALQSAGAHLDINQIARSIPVERSKIDLHRLHSLGANMDEIVIHDGFEPYSFDEINDLIINGVSVQTTFDLSEDYILNSAEYPDALFKILNFFYNHGIDSGQIRKMISKIVPVRFIDGLNLLCVANLIDDIIEGSSDKWIGIGVKPRNYTKPWIFLHCDDYLDIEPGETLANLPWHVTIHDFIHHTGLPFIMSKINYRGLTLKQFIECNYLPAGGDIEELAKEANYTRMQPENPIDWLVLAYLSDSGSKLVNRKILLECGDPSHYTGEDYTFAKEFMKNESAQ